MAAISPILAILPQQRTKRNYLGFSCSQVQCSANVHRTNYVSKPVTKTQPTIYQPSNWSFDYLQSLKSEYTHEMYKEKANELREDVRRMIKASGKAEPLASLQLIDDIQRLGLGYRFEEEIREVLDRYISLERVRGDSGMKEKSLHETALNFRLLREHGYHVSQDVFKRFTDHNGGINGNLCKDVQGMLGFYEASFLGFEGENILDEAMEFTTRHLKDQLISSKAKGNDMILNQGLLEHVNHALELPLHHRIQRLEARWYIQAYAKREDANLLLLEASILDFNIVQSTLQQDLQNVSRWWKEIDLANKLSFSRDRLMECFFWAAGMAFQPQFSDLRKGLTKVASFITTIDDVYDVQGTMEELELFTTAVERWDINALDILPEYMKICFLALYNTVNDMAYENLKGQGINILPFLKNAWAETLKAFLQEAKWSYNKEIPMYKEYFENAWVSVSGLLTLVHANFLMGHDINDIPEGGQYSDLFRCPSVIFRLCNDMATWQTEMEGGKTANSLVCYMRENCASEECAYEHIHKVMLETWKGMNKARASNLRYSKPFVETAMNLARIARCTYQYGDAHGAPDNRSMSRVRSLIVEPITLSPQRSQAMADLN